MPEAPDGSPRDDSISQIAATLQAGLVFVDPAGEVLWMDDKTRRRIDGGLRKLELPLRKQDMRAAAECMLGVVEIEIAGEPQTLIVAQAVNSRSDAFDVHRIVAAVEEVVADASWFTIPLLDKLKARLQVTQPAAHPTDLELLTARERQVLMLVCEGRSDAEMGQILTLSQNTVRNHIASLFKKIGVNRRSAAVIWARERAITCHDLGKPGLPRRSGAST